MKFSIKPQDSEILRGGNFIYSGILKLINYFGGNKKMLDALKARNSNLEEETKTQREQISGHEDRIRGLEKTVSEKTKESNRDKEMTAHAQETLNLYETEIKDRDLQIKDLIERASENYDPIPRLLSGYNKPALEGFLDYFKVKQSDKQPHEKIPKCTREHHAPMGYFEFVKRASRNKHVEKIVSVTEYSSKGEKTRVLGIVDDCIHVLYCEDNFGREVRVHTTTTKELENRIISEILLR